MSSPFAGFLRFFFILCAERTGVPCPGVIQSSCGVHLPFSAVYDILDKHSPNPFVPEGENTIGHFPLREHKRELEDKYIIDFLS